MQPGRIPDPQDRQLVRMHSRLGRCYSTRPAESRPLYLQDSIYRRACIDKARLSCGINSNRLRDAQSNRDFKGARIGWRSASDTHSNCTIPFSLSFFV